MMNLYINKYIIDFKLYYATAAFFLYIYFIEISMNNLFLYTFSTIGVFICVVFMGLAGVSVLLLPLQDENKLLKVKLEDIEKKIKI